MKIHIKYLLIVLLFSLSRAVESNAQTEKGYFPLQNFSPKDYGALPQNWTIVQDDRGIMYIGNNGGIIEYDGINWNLIETPNETSVHSLAIDEKGRIYIGAQGEIGYLLPDSIGSMSYYSLLNNIPEQYRDFDEVWKIIIVDDKVYFQAHKYIYILKEDIMEVLKPLENSKFSDIFYVNNTIYVCSEDIGLTYLEDNNTFKLIKDIELLEKQRARFMLPHDNSILMGIKDQGFYILSNESNLSASLTPFSVQNNDFFNTNTIYNGITIKDNQYSIGTFGGGVAILDNKGQLNQLFNKNTGLQDETVYSQFIDNSDNLWLALSNGFSRIDIHTPITSYNENIGLNGSVQSIIRYNNIIYVATLLGTYYLNNNETQNVSNYDIAYFDKVKEINVACWAFHPFIIQEENILLVITNDGLYSIDKTNKAKQIIKNNSLYALHQSKKDPSRIFLSIDDSLSSIYFQDGNWIKEGKVKDISGIFPIIVEEKDGSLWLGTYDQSVTHCKNIVLENHKIINADITNYNDKNGLPVGAVYVTQVNGKTIFATSQGIYRFNIVSSYFIPDTTYEKSLIDGSKFIHRISEDPEGNQWMVTIVNDKYYDIGYLDNEENWINTHFLEISKGIIQAIYHDKEGITWLGGSDGLYRFDSKVEKEYNKNYNTLIRRVTIGTDSTIFKGNFYLEDKTITTQQPDFLKPIIIYKYNSISFEFAAQNVVTETPLVFSYYLEGFSDSWTDWKTETKAVYTNLPENTYKFRVKAKNLYKNEGIEAVYEFTILAPWYRTVWAYISYIIAFIAFVYGAITVSTRGLQAIIRERTAEIMRQKDEIEEINRDIMDSIRYAKRIQEAILPPADFVKEYLVNSFILYKPKDIVSGDFYWMEVKENKVLFAAVDCTGHGVPGAFMSIVGHNGLNQAVNQYKLTQPAEILNHLNKSVSETLRQKQHESAVKDGMDISLCCLDLNNRSLEFAGAFNPLYIIRKTDVMTEESIEEVKANKHPIGSFLGEENKEFTNNELTLNSGDTVYVFSDGYADQFGGPKGKKFKSKQFKELLLSIQDKSMDEQRDILDKAIEDWRGEIAQIDDICVIGVRV